MAGGIIGALAGAVLPGVLPDVTATAKILVDRLVPDPAARAEAQRQIEEAIAAREAALVSALQKEAEQQNALNLAEAQSPSIFVAGWRPACAWICVFGFFYSFILAPIVGWASAIVGTALGFALPVPPSLDTGSLTTMLVGMLGLGTLRMTEKLNGVGTANLTAPLAGTPATPPPRLRR